MVEWIVIGAAAGGLAVKAWDFFVESLNSDAHLSYTEREAIKKKAKEDAELREWSNRSVLSDDAFKRLQEKLHGFLAVKNMTYAYPESLIKEVFNCGMRFSIKQIYELMPLASHWCYYPGAQKEDKEKAQKEFRVLVKENLTSQVEAKEAMLNMLIDERP